MDVVRTDPQSAPASAPAAGAGPIQPALGVRRGRALVVGATASVTSAAAGALLAAWSETTAPVAAVAGVVIDRVPGPVRRWAISTFGTSDKLVLGIGIVVVLALVGAVVAAVAPRRPAVVPAVVIALAVVGLWAADRVGAAELLTTVVSVTVAAFVFRVLGRYVVAHPATEPVAAPGSPFTTEAAEPTEPAATTEPAAPVVAEPMVRHRWEAPVDRRDFVVRAGSLWATAAIAGSLAAAVGRAADTSRRVAARRFPTLAPGTPEAGPAVPASASIGKGVGPFITPNDDFYRIDTAFAAPRISIDDWRLEIRGAVDRPLTLTYDQLLERRVIERVVTLCCVSNEVGGDLVGTARFLGVPLADLLEEAGVDPDDDRGAQLASTSVDGWTCGFPTKLALDGRDALVAVGMNGEPLPIEHGFPARLVIPGLYGYVSATKWLQRIELVGWDEFDGYWIPRGWAKEAPVKTQSRIDVPRDGDEVTAGKVAVAGVAWAQHRGIDGVEVRIDDGEWRPARLGDEVTVDAWRQWVVEWDATPGTHTIAVRATDGAGDTQTATEAPPAPDGATGHHTITVDVA